MATVLHSFVSREETDMKTTKLMAIMIAGTFQVFGERRIVVSIPDHKVALIEDGRVVRTYGVAVGKPSTPSPAGTFEIIARVQNPTWYGPGKVVGPGAGNPLGTRWMGLSRKGYGIHGTNVPSSIGKSASHGCIRMRNQDAEDLFNRVQVGDRVDLMTELPADLTGIFAAPQTVASAADAGGLQ
jgi:L,D-transpeptidase ErfK/SrfK